MTTTREWSVAAHAGAAGDLALRVSAAGPVAGPPFKIDWPGMRDDFESAACLALVEAAEAFDPERNVKFATFARHRIWGALRDVQRGLVALGWRCDPKHAPTVGAMPRDPERKGRVLAPGQEGPVGQEMEDIEAVEALAQQLPARHARPAARSTCTARPSTRRPAPSGCSQSRLSYIHREAMSILNGTWEAQVRGRGRLAKDAGRRRSGFMSACAWDRHGSRLNYQRIRIKTEGITHAGSQAERRSVDRGHPSLGRRPAVPGL